MPAAKWIARIMFALRHQLFCWLSGRVQTDGFFVRNLVLWIALLTACASNSAVAQSCSVDTAHTANVTFPATVSVSRDAPVGTMLTNWIRADSEDNWVCQGGAGVYTLAWVELAVASQDIVSVAGKQYSVVGTGVPGVGIIVRFFAVGTSISSTTTRTAVVGDNLKDGKFEIIQRGATGESDVSIKVRVSLALVRTSMEPLTASSISGGRLGQTGISFTRSNAINSPSNLRYAHGITYTGVNFTVKTCVTPDVNISMGNVPLSTFTNSGMQTGPWVNRTLNINNCPANLNRVKILFNTPATGWLDSASKVFKLNDPAGPNTAQGIGIQMSFGANNAAVSYDTYQILSGYAAIKATGGSFNVPIGARYVKPASSVRISGGTASGSIIFDMLYE